MNYFASKTFLIASLAFICLFSVSLSAHAQSGTPLATPQAVTNTNQSPTPPMAPVQSNNTQKVFSLQNPLRSDLNSVGAVVSKFVEIFSYIAIILAVLAFVWVGFQFIL